MISVCCTKFHDFVDDKSVSLDLLQNGAKNVGRSNSIALNL